jgi:hypothetical protein
VIAAGFREVAQRRAGVSRPSYLPKSWRATREDEEIEAEPVAARPEPPTEVIQQVRVDDLDVPTFLRRQAEKA